MSTAITLQDMNAVTQHEPGVIRKRPISSFDSGVSPESGLHDEWLDRPHDTLSRLETCSFAPTNTYWITPHSILTKQITILDLTKDLDVPYTGLTDTYKAEVKKTLKDHSFTPVLTCHRSNWLGLKYKITNDKDEVVAEWSHPWSSVGAATLTSTSFPHPLTLRPRTWGLRTESFTLNSIPYIWEMDSMWHSTNMTLYKVFGSSGDQTKVEIAKYAQKWWGGFVTGGTIVVDETEGEGLMGMGACLTACVVLKKKRQRAAERKSGGE
ncbi:hypothetical protein N0V90_001189 [Kalmusia sp. IMI 367209]|nr:hypothetical protein N0V90_001189 [Kalmusia sp. IMI 367209]